MTIEKTLIIGVGLIGGSFAKAIRAQKISKEIFAQDIDYESIELAKSEGVIDGGFDKLEYFASDLASFDLIVIAAPLSAYENIFSKIVKKTSPKAIIIDLGSIKDFRIKNLPTNFIPCHPIAGSENTGFEYSSADLFLGKKFIICSQHQFSNEIAKIAEKIGSKVEFLETKKHDEIYALVSHLPQFLSFLTAEFSPKNIEDKFFKNAFRLDKSSPYLWFDIFSMNEKNIEKFYLKFFENLDKNIAFICESPLSEFETINSIFDEKTLVENFSAIFFRALMVKSYLEIPEIESFKKYSGNGFKDFTSIIEIANLGQEKLRDLIKKNQSEIINLFEKINKH